MIDRLREHELARILVGDHSADHDAQADHVDDLVDRRAGLDRLAGVEQRRRVLASHDLHAEDHELTLPPRESAVCLGVLLECRKRMLTYASTRCGSVLLKQLEAVDRLLICLVVLIDVRAARGLVAGC